MLQSNESTYRELRKYIENNQIENLQEFFQKLRPSNFNIDHIFENENREYEKNSTESIQNYTSIITQETFLHKAIINGSIPIVTLLIQQNINSKIPYTKHTKLVSEEYNRYSGMRSTQEMSGENIRLDSIELAIKEGKTEIADLIKEHNLSSNAFNRGLEMRKGSDEGNIKLNSNSNNENNQVFPEKSTDFLNTKQVFAEVEKTIEEGTSSLINADYDKAITSFMEANTRIEYALDLGMKIISKVETLQKKILEQFDQNSAVDYELYSAVADKMEKICKGSGLLIKKEIYWRQKDYRNWIATAHSLADVPNYNYTIKDIKQKFLAKLEEKYVRLLSIQNLEKTNNNSQENRTSELYSIIAPNTVGDELKKKERKRKLDVEDRFFDPARTKKRATCELAVQLQANRIEHSNAEVKPIMASIPARRLITAERSIQNTSFSFFGDTFKLNKTQDGKTYQDTELGWYSNEGNTPNEEQAYDKTYSNKEILQIKKTKIRYMHRTNPNWNRLGDCRFIDIGNYKSIIQIIHTITGSKPKLAHKENEKKLTQLMVRLSRTGQAIALKELQDINVQCTQEHIDKITQITFLILYNEPSQWLLAKEEKFKQPRAIAQARAIKLILANILTIEDILSPESPYSVFSVKNIIMNPEVIEANINNIDRLYDAYFKNQNFEAHIDVLKKKASLNFTLSKQSIRKDLQDIYGGESDTDGEGYQSENEQDISQSYKP